MDLIRVSCAALCLIEIDDLVLLEVNKNRGDVLTPLGGALEFHEAACPVLTELGAVFEKGMDLRFRIPAENLSRFETWFRQRCEREVSPLRELKEELIEEHGALLRWPDNDVVFDYLGISLDRVATTRRGLEGVTTSYFFELFSATFDARTVEILVQALSQPGSRLRLVPKEAILAGVDATDGMVVAASAKMLCGA